MINKLCYWRWNIKWYREEYFNGAYNKILIILKHIIYWVSYITGWEKKVRWATDLKSFNVVDKI